MILNAVVIEQLVKWKGKMKGSVGSEGSEGRVQEFATEILELFAASAILQ